MQHEELHFLVGFDFIFGNDGGTDNQDGDDYCGEQFGDWLLWLILIQVILMTYC